MIFPYHVRKFKCLGNLYRLMKRVTPPPPRRTRKNFRLLSMSGQWGGGKEGGWEGERTRLEECIVHVFCMLGVDEMKFCL
jgi:hypothetical protein